MPNERELGIFLAIKQILATMILEWETLLKLPSGILKELATTQFGPHLSFEIEMPARDEHFIFTDDVIQTFRRQHYALLKV
jgi:hypothetical protein